MYTNLSGIGKQDNLLNLINSHFFVQLHKLLSFKMRANLGVVLRQTCLHLTSAILSD